MRSTLWEFLTLIASINIMNVRITKCAPNTLRDFRLLLATYTLPRASNLRSKIIFFARCALFARSAFLFYRMTRLRGISYRTKKGPLHSISNRPFFLSLFIIYHLSIPHTDLYQWLLLSMVRLLSLY